jgi:cytochrome c-type biogenesis protein CcmH/NrfG
MNIGIVRLNGLNDAAGAIASWEKLLRVAPQFPERQRVTELIAQARAASK